MDLIIRKEDGWKEITDWLDLSTLDVPKLWGAVGAGDRDTADELIREALNVEGEINYESFLYPNMPDDWDGSQIEDWGKRRKPEVKIVSLPDDMMGDLYIIWARVPPGPFDWMPRD